MEASASVQKRQPSQKFNTYREKVKKLRESDNQLKIQKIEAMKAGEVAADTSPIGIINQMPNRTEARRRPLDQQQMKENYRRTTIQILNQIKESSAKQIEEKASFSAAELKILTQYSYLNQPKGSPYWVPTWVKMIILHRYMIQNPKEVIDHFSQGLVQNREVVRTKEKEIREEIGDPSFTIEEPYRYRIHPDIIDDLLLQPLPDVQNTALSYTISKLDLNQEKVRVLKVEVMDEIRPPIEIQVSQFSKVKTLKKLILRSLGTPFFFEIQVDNNAKIDEFLKKQHDHRRSKRQEHLDTFLVRVFTNIDYFDFKVKFNRNLIKEVEEIPEPSRIPNMPNSLVFENIPANLGIPKFLDMVTNQIAAANKETIILDCDIYIQQKRINETSTIVFTTKKDNPKQMTVPGFIDDYKPQDDISMLGITRFTQELSFSISSLILHVPANTYKDQKEKIDVHFSYEKVRYLNLKQLKETLLLQEDSYKSLVYFAGEVSGEHISERHLEKGGLQHRAIKVQDLICEGFLYFEIEFDVGPPFKFRQRINPQMKISKLLSDIKSVIQRALKIKPEQEHLFHCYVRNLLAVHPLFKECISFESSTIKECGIEADQTVRLKWNSSSSQLYGAFKQERQINITISYDKYLCLKYNPLHFTMHLDENIFKNLKTQIEKKLGVPMKYQRLFFGSIQVQTVEELRQMIKTRSVLLGEDNYTALTLRVSRECIVVNCCGKFIAYKPMPFTAADLKNAFTMQEVSQLNPVLVGQEGLESSKKYFTFSSDDNVTLQEDFQLKNLQTNFVLMSICSSFGDQGFTTDSVKSRKVFILRIQEFRRSQGLQEDQEEEEELSLWEKLKNSLTTDKKALQQDRIRESFSQQIDQFEQRSEEKALQNASLHIKYLKQELRMGNDLFRLCVLSFTSDAVFDDINAGLTLRKDRTLRDNLPYFHNLISGLPRKELEIEDANCPVYRGLDRSPQFDIDDYMPGKINFWPAMTSTSLSYKVARDWSVKVCANNHRKQSIIFEIFLSQKNTPKHHLVLKDRWSFHPKEKEVLILPFFCFQAVRICTTKLSNGISETKITVAEIPFQDGLNIDRPLRMANIRVAFLTNKTLSQFDSILMPRLLQHASELKYDFHHITAKKEISEVLRSSIKLILVVTGQQGSKVLPNLPEAMAEESSMKTIVLAQNEEMVAKHKEWARKVPTVIEVTHLATQLKESLEMQLTLFRTSQDENL